MWRRAISRFILAAVLACTGTAPGFSQAPDLPPVVNASPLPLDNTQRENPMTDVHAESIAPGASHLEIEEDQIFLLVTVENRPMRFCIDTGSSFSMMEPEAARVYLDGKLHEERTLRGYGGSQRSTSWTRPIEFHFPGVAGRASMLVMATGLSNYVPLQCDGILGLDFLSQFRVCIDYTAQTITFSLPDATPPPGISFAVKTFKVLLPVTIAGKNGSKTGMMMLDTGASGSVKLYRGAQSLGFDDFGEVTAHALGGTDVNHCVRVDSLDVGGFPSPFHNIMGQVGGGSTPSGEGQNLLGGIGGNILHHFRITLDLPHNLVSLEPNEPVDPADDAFEPSLTSLGGVYPDSPENKQKMEQHFKILRAARQGNAIAAEYVGVNYAAGRGVPQDFTQAAFWLKRAAAAQGCHVADYVLGMMYESGYGVPMNATKAISLYEAAAAEDDRLAENALGGIFEIGRGVTPDIPTALSWYRRAADHGLPAAKSAVARLSGTPIQSAPPVAAQAAIPEPPGAAPIHYSGK